MTAGLIEGPTVRAQNDSEDRTVWGGDALTDAADLEDLLSRRADISTRRQGSLGGLVSLSIRGARSGQTDLQIEGVSLPGGLTDADVMRLIDPRIFGQIQFLLGGAQSLGGQIQLKARRGHQEGPSGALEFGDNGEIRSVWRLRGKRATNAFTIIQDPGQFTYLETRGTVDEADDKWAVRRRNRRSKVNLLSTVRLGAQRAGLFAASLGGEVPGSIGAPLRSVSEQQTMVIGWLRHQRRRPRVDGFEFHLAAAHRQSTFLDPFGERFGLLAVAPSEGHSRLELGATKSASDLWTASLRAIDHRLGRINLRADDQSLRSGSRQELRGTLRLRLKPGDQRGVFVVGHTKLRWTVDRLDPLAVGIDPQTESNPKKSELSPRLALQIGHRSSTQTGSTTLALVGRNPTPFERVGTYGGVLGNPSLKAERGLSLRADWSQTHQNFRLKLGLYGREMTDLIDWVQTAPDVIRPINRGQVDVAGALIRLHLGNRRMGLSLGYHANINRVRVDERDEHPLRLAAQPTHRLRLAWRVKRPQWIGEWVLRGQSASTLDAANLRPVGGSLVSDWTARWMPFTGATYALTLKIRNLFNRRVVEAPLLPSTTIAQQPLADLRGFPLPGRQIMLGLQFPQGK
jgi:hypothetical protein